MTVWIIVLHISVWGHSGRIMPEGDNLAFASEQACVEQAPIVRQAFLAIRRPVNLDDVVCEAFPVQQKEDDR